MRVSIHQPAYLPWLGHFHRLLLSDLYVSLDHVQFEKNSYINRNKVRVRDGSTWLTVPVRTSGRFGAIPIEEVEIADDRWRRKHMLTLEACYSRAEHFSEHRAYFEELYSREWPRLIDLLEETDRYLLGSLGLKTRSVRSSELGVRSAKDQLVVDICREVGATEYISGPLGRDYLHPAAFEEAGIAVSYHSYRHPEYRQAFPGFVPELSVVDVLFNHGAGARAIIESGQEALDTQAR